MNDDEQITMAQLKTMKSVLYYFFLSSERKIHNFQFKLRINESNPVDRIE